MKVKFNAVCNGTSLWSRRAGQIVEITDLYIGYLAEKDNKDDEDYGELCAYFAPSTWMVQTDGLIYTDKGWMEEFRKRLLALGFSKEGVEDVDYSEQGMQGENYVSMDFGHKFYADWKRINGSHVDEE